ncbi:TnsA-like heteromeric transposase endonuclease subunit, partial [Streptomyces sp. UNOB3_S3]|uniref:TnsA-like heteromeric transposase endonuclease subunit n=1 Tax=Streptomyces sp. UNOB3_S3 TaxID=2871682 RepID=UPI001E4B9CA6
MIFPEVVAVADALLDPVMAQLVWADGGGERLRPLPADGEFCRRLGERLGRNGTGMLADCPSHAEAGGERAMKAAAAVAEACWQVGFVYRRLERLDEVVEANVKWLAGYRHPRNQGRKGLAAVREAFAQPRPLMEGVEAIGDPIEVLPAVFHALWRGRLTAPLDVPLHERALVHVAGPGAEGCAARRAEAGAGRGIGDDTARGAALRP